RANTNCLSPCSVTGGTARWASRLTFVLPARQAADGQWPSGAALAVARRIGAGEESLPSGPARENLHRDFSATIYWPRSRPKHRFARGGLPFGGLPFLRTANSDPADLRLRLPAQVRCAPALSNTRKRRLPLQTVWRVATGRLRAGAKGQARA